MLWTDFVDNNGWMDPWREFERLNRTFSRMPRRNSIDFPAINLWVDSDLAIVTTEIPGLDVQDINISVIGKSLTLRGSRKRDELGENESYHRQERWNGEFSKTVQLPFNIESEKVEAKLSRGVLRITLPKAEAERPKKIEIKDN